METVRIETTVQRNGRVVLDNLPFDEGEHVEVIIAEAKHSEVPVRTFRLKGTLLKYDDPFEPATPVEDWDALQ